MSVTQVLQSPDRVRAHSACEINERIDQETQLCLARLADKGKEEITEHLHELSREWDMERRLQANASLLAFSGVVLGATVNKKWRAVPAVVFSFFLQHSLQGWCPPVLIFRRFGARTSKEINREKYALKLCAGISIIWRTLHSQGKCP